MRRCQICGRDISNRGSSAKHCVECHIAYRREYNKKKEKEPKVIAIRKAYKQRPEIKQRIKEQVKQYQQRPEVKKQIKKYKEGYKQTLEYKKSLIKYNQSKKAKQIKEKWNKSLKGKEYKKKWMKEYAKSLKGKERRKIRNDARKLTKDLVKLYDGKCCWCGCSERLQKHHFEYINELKSIWLLCKDCHDKYNQGAFFNILK